MSFIIKNTVESPNEANIGIFNHAALIIVPQNNLSKVNYSYQIVKKKKIY